MFHTEIIENIKTRILCSVTLFRICCRLRDNVEKFGKARQDTSDNIIWRIRFVCWKIKATTEVSGQPIGHPKEGTGTLSRKKLPLFTT